MVKLLIFDVGGVIDTFDEIKYIDYITKKLKINRKEYERLLKHLLDKMEVGKLSLKDAKKILSKKFNVSQDSLEWESSFRKINTVNEDVVNLISRLSRKYTIAILTNVSRSRHEVKMEMYLHRVKYDAIFASCYLKMHKPDPRIYLFVSKKMKTKPNESVFIDNMKVNVDGAKRVGMKGIQFRSYKDLVKKLKVLGVES